MVEFVLTAYPREDRGKNAMRRLRLQGVIPGIFYGQRYKATAISINQKDLERAVSSKRRLVNLNIEGVGNYEVIFREIQRDPASEKIQHIDLLGITRGEKIITTVPVRLVGTPIGVKEGGILEFVRRNLRIECFPKDMPDEIVVEVSSLPIGESIHVEDISVENVTILNNPKGAIAAVIPPTVIKIAAEVEAAEEAELEEEAEADKEEKSS